MIDGRLKRSAGSSTEHEARDEAERDALETQPHVRSEHIEPQYPQAEDPRDGGGTDKEQRRGEGATEERHDQRLGQMVAQEAPAARADRRD